MAKAEQKSFIDAENHLDRGYHEAKAYEKRTGKSYNRRQLDDRKAKFLMNRLRNTNRDTGGLFRDFDESLSICRRLINDHDVTHHPFETLRDIATTFVSHSGRLSPNTRSEFKTSISELITAAGRRVTRTPEGYQRSVAERALRDGALAMERA